MAVFGCGDSQSYADNFCDGIEELHNAFQAAGAKMVGYVDEAGYSYEESKSVAGSSTSRVSVTYRSLLKCHVHWASHAEMTQVKDGKFLGLPLDEDNEDDQTDDRIAAWVEQLKGEGMPL